MKRPSKLSGPQNHKLNGRLRRRAALPAPVPAPAPVPEPASSPAAAPGAAVSAAAPDAAPQAQALAAVARSIYAGELTSEEIALIAARFADIIVDDEIWMQRALNRRLLNLFSQLLTETRSLQDDDGRSISLVIKTANALTAGTGRVASLMRAKRALVGDAADGLAGAVAAVLEEISTQMGLQL
jgi:hypothetical protein